jgi:hypothetical protein
MTVAGTARLYPLVSDFKSDTCSARRRATEA